LVFLKYLDFTNKFKKISKLSEYSLKINYLKAFKYNETIYISKNCSKIFQKNDGEAYVEFYRQNKIYFEGKKLNLIKKFNFKNLQKIKNSNYYLLRFILNNLSKYVGTVFPGKNATINSININYSFKKLFQFEINKYVGWFLTFNYVNLSLIFFRSNTLDNSISIIKGMLGLNGFSFPIFFEDKIYIILILLISIIISFAFKNTKYLLENFRLENK
jgi:hypothetical protein